MAVKTVANVDSNVLLTITPRAYKERHVTTTLSLVSGVYGLPYIGKH